MVIASVVEETHGVLRYQIVQTAPAALTIRFDEFLHAQGAAAVTVNPLRSPHNQIPQRQTQTRGQGAADNTGVGSRRL